jgi:hypothetical protein
VLRRTSLSSGMKKAAQEDHDRNALGDRPIKNGHRVATIDLDSRQNARDVVADFVVARIGRRFASKHASNDLISI